MSKKKVLATLALMATVPVAIGLTGCMGEQGERGERGYRGTHWTIGATKPSGNYLKKGDIHLTPEGRVYKYRAEGTGAERWEYQFNITGPQGEPGAAGNVPGAIQAILNVEYKIANATTTAEIQAAIVAFGNLNEFQRQLVSNFDTLNSKAATLVQFIGTYMGGTIAEQETEMATLKTAGVTASGNTINVQLTGTQNRAVINFGQIPGLVGADMYGTVVPYEYTAGSGSAAGTWSAMTPHLNIIPLSPVTQGETASANTWRRLGTTNGTVQTAVDWANANANSRLLYVYPTHDRIAFATPAYFNQNLAGAGLDQNNRVRVQLTGHNGVVFTFVINLLAPTA